MLTTYEKFRMQDVAGKNDWFVEVNYDEKEMTKNCGTLKVTFPDGTQAYTKRDFLNAMLFVIGSPEEQSKMIPQTLIHKRRFTGLVCMKAKKDIARGEDIIATCFHDLPDFEERIISKVENKINT